MKVKISKYPTDWLRCKIHDSYMDKKYGYTGWPNEENQTRFENLLQWLEDKIQSFYNLTINKVIKYRKRRISVHIDNYDVWNADNTLAHIIHPILLKLKENKQGVPFTDDEDVPKELRSTSASPKKNEWDTDDLHDARWDWILNEMIYAFECELDDDWDQQFRTGEIDFVEDKKKTINGTTFTTFKRGPNHTFVHDAKGEKKAWKRRDNGRRLFAKYYHNLWT